MWSPFHTTASGFTNLAPKVKMTDGDADDCNCDDNAHAQCQEHSFCTLRKRNRICVMSHIGACHSSSSFVSVLCVH